MLSISNDFADSATRITNLGVGTAMTPTRILLHYTAGSSLSGSQRRTCRTTHRRPSARQSRRRTRRQRTRSTLR